MAQAESRGPTRPRADALGQGGVGPAEGEVHRVPGRPAGAVHAANESRIHSQVAAEGRMPSLILSQHLLVAQR